MKRYRMTQKERLLRVHSLLGNAALVAEIAEGKEKDIRRWLFKALVRAQKEIIKVANAMSNEDEESHKTGKV